jgi:hypothetical protein
LEKEKSHDQRDEENREKSADDEPTTRRTGLDFFG